MRFVTVASISLAATTAAASSSTPAEARTDCAGTLGCIAGTQYCSLNNGQLINLHTACTGSEDDGSDEGDDDNDWKRAVDARADCAGSLGCIAGTQYCSYNGQLTNLHITCGDNWEGGDDGDDGDNWKRDIAARVDCPGSLGCIAGTQYCSYNNGSLISLHIACGDNWEGGDDDGDDRKRSEEDKAKRYTCSGSIGCVAGTEYCSYGDNNGWHWDNMGTPCQAGDAPIYMTDDNDSDTWTGTHTHTHTGTDSSQSTTSWTTVVASPTTSVTVVTTTPSGASAASTITSSAVVTPTIVAAVTGTTKATTTTSSSSSVSKAGAPRATAGAGLLAGVAIAAVFL